MVGTLFGTDGIRGVANKYPMDCETAIKVGRAVANYFGNHEKHAKILIGCDPRVSSHMITSAITSGICSMGVDVVFAGILPTPGVAYLTTEENFCAGLVVSASHNEFYDNGIKLFDRNGCKLNSFVEADLESMIGDSFVQNKSEQVQHVGQLSLHRKPVKKYNSFLEASFSDVSPIEGIKIILDCSNGAASVCAPLLFKKLGANVTPVFCSPDGTNINNNCGSEYPEILAKIVLDREADIGLGLDGDGDRLIAVSELGDILTGDHLLAIFANDLKNRGLLEENTVVSTIMSNFGLEIALQKMGINLIKSEVGDRHVYKRMKESGATLGGENSGHIIFANQQNTGDGLFAAIQLLTVLKKYNLPLSELSKIITLYPQCLISVDVNSKPDLSKIEVIKNAILLVEKKLQDTGRVLIRYSGTQPKCRIMVEGYELKNVKEHCSYISEVITKCLGR